MDKDTRAKLDAMLADCDNPGTRRIAELIEQGEDPFKARDLVVSEMMEETKQTMVDAGYDPYAAEFYLNEEVDRPGKIKKWEAFKIIVRRAYTHSLMFNSGLVLLVISLYLIFAY